uniref:Fibronectin type-III domain-containing protein n=1 Tax=Parastrongyloides trichosuri TaxID=131310 RepID=A0A0N4ZWM2_PARTI
MVYINYNLTIDWEDRANSTKEVLLELTYTTSQDKREWQKIENPKNSTVIFNTDYPLSLPNLGFKVTITVLQRYNLGIGKNGVSTTSTFLNVKDDCLSCTASPNPCYETLSLRDDNRY